jgi:pimeloyl-ACP methyl ester carboxylesterase
METTAPTTVDRRAERLRRMALSIAATLVTLVMALYLGISTYAASTLTMPQRDTEVNTPATFGARFEDVRFPARGEDVEIAAWYLPQPDASRVVILIHGKDSSRSTEFQGRFSEFAVRLHERGFAVLLIDLRGHGASGDARFSFGLAERRDILGAVDWLMAQGFRAGSIGVLGVSMGAASAIGAAAADPAIGALVADCSYAEIEPLMQRHWGAASGLPDIFLPSTLFMGRFILGMDLATARPVTEIDDIAPRPVLIIHGSADAFTPVEHGRALAAAAPAAEYWEVPDAGHARSYEVEPQQYVDRVTTFFLQHLTG